MKIQLLVLFGGKSVEHEISIISAIQAIHHIDREAYDVIPVYMTKEQDFYTGPEIASIEAYRDLAGLVKRSQKVILAKEEDRVYVMSHPSARGFKKIKKPIDIALPIVHGSHVEDGTLQGYLKTLGLSFVGCDVVSSAIGIDKCFAKSVLKDHGLPVLDGMTCRSFAYERDPESTLAAIEGRFAYPVIVKPATLGSSIGISKAADRDELRDALDLAFSFAIKVLIEPAVVHLREINCSVIGDAEEAEASECEEPLNATTILSYEDKYIGNASKAGSQGMATLSRQIPAAITPEERSEIRSLAVKTFAALDCNGLVRIDFLYDVDAGRIYINEVNTIPGSLAFYLWEPLGIPYGKLIDRLIRLGLKRVRNEKGLMDSFDTNVLSLCSNAGLKGSKGKLKY